MPIVHSSVVSCIHGQIAICCKLIFAQMVLHVLLMATVGVHFLPLVQVGLFPKDLGFNKSIVDYLSTRFNWTIGKRTSREGVSLSSNTQFWHRFYSKCNYRCSRCRTNGLSDRLCFQQPNMGNDHHLWFRS